MTTRIHASHLAHLAFIASIAACSAVPPAGNTGGGGNDGGSSGDAGGGGSSSGGGSDSGMGSDGGPAPDGSTEGGVGATCAPAKYSLGVAKPYPGKPGDSGIAIGDLNGDGFADIVTGDNTDVGAGNTRNTVGVMMNKGDGTFAATVTYPYAGAPSFPPNYAEPDGIVLADLNGDGKLDVIAGGTQSATAYMLNNGDGTLAPPVMLGSQPDSAGNVIATADFNADGTTDIVTVDYPGILVWLNAGGASFGGSVGYAIPSTGQGLAVADFNGDQSPDVAVLQSTTVYILANDGHGVFSMPTTFTVPDSFEGSCPCGVGQGLAAADFDGDGKVDLASLDTSNGVSISINKGNGTFKTPVSYQIGGNGANWLVAADLNDDGKPDVAVVQDGGVAYAMNKGDGTFGTPTSVAAPYTSQFAAGDFHGNKVLGLAMTQPHSASVDTDLVNVAQGSCK
jgi:hypothetical protein